MISCGDDACEEDIHSIIDMTTTNRFSALSLLSLSVPICGLLPITMLYINPTESSHRWNPYLACYIVMV